VPPPIVSIQMAATDFTILNALAARIGENATVEMAEAYLAAVRERRAGIEPPIWVVDDNDEMPPLVALNQPPQDVNSNEYRAHFLTRMDTALRNSHAGNIQALFDLITEAQWLGLTNEEVYIDACSRLEALYALTDNAN
jgi:hypothetical protein